MPIANLQTLPGALSQHLLRCVGLIFLASLFCNFCNSCTTPDTAISLGIQAGYESYIPARIAVLSSQDWPLRARFPNTLPSKLSKEDKAPLYEALDAYVLQSFADQPFLKGYTPNVIAQLLERSNQAQLLGEFPELWSLDPKTCSAEGRNRCTSAAQTYTTAIADKAPWRLWLNTFSRASNYADAILLPFIVEAYEYQYRDRGLFVSERTVNLALLLVDTNNGHLLWAGGRKATAVNQDLDSSGGAFPVYPPWTLVYERLLLKDLWKEFPGRLTH